MATKIEKAAVHYGKKFIVERESYDDQAPSHKRTETYHITTRRNSSLRVALDSFAKKMNIGYVDVLSGTATDTSIDATYYDMGVCYKINIEPQRRTRKSKYRRLRLTA